MIKKAELSINMIVVIVLALLCLVLIVYVLFNTSDGFRGGTDCLSSAGRCVPADRCDTTDYISANCGDDSNVVCCPINQVS